MMTKRRYGLAVVAIALLAVACGGGGRGAGGGTRVRIAVGGASQLLYLPTTLAQQLGYYKDEGLDVELEDFAGGSKALEALVGGSADVVSGFYDHTIQMAAEGRELVAFVAMLRYPGLVLAVSPKASDTVKSIEDVKGRIAGVTAAGSSTQMLLTYLLTRHHVDPSEVSISAIGTSATAIAAVEHGRVDVAMMADPAFTLVAKRDPAVRILADLRRADGVKDAFGTGSYPGSVLYSSGDWIRAHPDTTARLARAIKRTLAWMQAHSAADIAAKMPAAFRGDDNALYVEALGNSMTMYSPDGVMAADGAEIVHTLLAQSMEKVRNATIDLSKTYTNEYVR